MYAPYDMSTSNEERQPRMLKVLLTPSVLLGILAGCVLLLTSSEFLLRISVCIYLGTLIPTALVLASNNDSTEIRPNWDIESRSTKWAYRTLSLLLRVMPILLGVCCVGELMQTTVASGETLPNHIVAALMVWTKALNDACFWAIHMTTTVTIIYVVASMHRRKRASFDPTSRVWKQVDTVAVWPPH